MENIQNKNNNNNNILQNRNRYLLIKHRCTVILYILLLEFVIYLFVKIINCIYNKIKNIKRE